VSEDTSRSGKGLAALCNPAWEGEGEDTSRSGKGLAALCNPAWGDLSIAHALLSLSSPMCLKLI